MGKSTFVLVIFHSYVKLPEGDRLEPEHVWICVLRVFDWHLQFKASWSSSMGGKPCDLESKNGCFWMGCEPSYKPAVVFFCAISNTKHHTPNLWVIQYPRLMCGLYTAWSLIKSELARNYLLSALLLRQATKCCCEASRPQTTITSDGITWREI